MSDMPVGKIEFGRELSQREIQDEHMKLFSESLMGKYRAAQDEVDKLIEENNGLLLSRELWSNLAKKYEKLLLRLYKWDAMDAAEDGPSWRKEIDEAIGRFPKSVE